MFTPPALKERRPSGQKFLFLIRYAWYRFTQIDELWQCSTAAGGEVLGVDHSPELKRDMASESHFLSITHRVM